MTLPQLLSFLNKLGYVLDENDEWLQTSMEKFKNYLKHF